jgi:MerR family transcriptional regulator, repressor of the yfmOP operon
MMRDRDETPEIPHNEPPAADRLRTIGAIAEEVGLTARAIRYYEEIGLLRPAIRVKGSSRLFDESDVQRLREIKRLREVIGFSLAEIAELLDADDVRDQLRSQFIGTTDPAVRARVLCDAIALAELRLGIVERKLAQVEAVRREELERLERLRAVLEEEQRAGSASDETGA